MVKVLMISDNWRFLGLMGELLNRKGHEVLRASDGQGGLEILAQIEDVDIIFYGYNNMVGMKGDEFARELRTNQRYQKNYQTTLIGTGDFSIDERRNLTEYYKPLDSDQIFECINRYTQ